MSPTLYAWFLLSTIRERICKETAVISVVWTLLFHAKLILNCQSLHPIRVSLSILVYLHWFVTASPLTFFHKSRGDRWFFRICIFYVVNSDLDYINIYDLDTIIIISHCEVNTSWRCTVVEAKRASRVVTCGGSIVCLRAWLSCLR